MATPSVTIAPSPEVEEDLEMARSRGAAAQKRCWNCRSRKTACDRTKPSCKNCIRRGLDCLGYGLKLSWPRANDTRRSTHGYQHCILPIRARKVEFVNATHYDIEGGDDRHRRRSADDEGEEDRRIRAYRRTTDIPKVSLAHFDPFLEPNNYSAISRIIFSSCDEISDLYTLLVKMSLGDETPPALAIRHAMAALSFQHLGERKVASVHQTKSLGALQVAVNTMSYQGAEPTQAFQAMAASMLLNIFETLNFDSSPLGWAIFFCGTKRIANIVHTQHATYEGDCALILDWIFYHDTLYKFCVRHWFPKLPDQVQLAAQEKIVSKAVFSPMRQLIVPSAGCSLEVLDLICRVTDTVHDRDDPRHLSPSHLATLRTLEFRLKNVRQAARVETAACSVGDSDTGRSASSSPSTEDAESRFLTQLAELYRLAAYIYLVRVAQATSRDAPAASALIDQAMALLKGMCKCERPWPLFVVALEAHTDEERRLILDIFDATLQYRPLGNLPHVKKMILSAWVHQDLYDGEGEVDQLVVYNTVVSGFGMRIPPSFT